MKLKTREKSLTILKNVVGIDLPKYEAETKLVPREPYLGVATQEDVHVNFESNGSKLELLCTFTNGNLNVIHVLKNKGSPQITKPSSNVIENAENFLEDYKNYSGNAIYGELSSMLNQIEDNKNLTTTSGNLKFEMNTQGESAAFKWTYVSDGVEAPSKYVSLGYKNGFLKYFADTWNLYKVGSTDVKLSEEEAIELALERVKSYSWKVGSGNNTYEINNFNATQAMVMNTVFCSSVDVDKTRNDDLMTIYPMRLVWVSLDKYYPGNVYGIEVYIWADTKEIFNIKERYSPMDPPADMVATINESSAEAQAESQSLLDAHSNSMEIGLIALLIVFILGAISVWLIKTRKYSWLCSSKLRAFKVCQILCIVLLALVFLSPISEVFADQYRGRATVWGSESTFDVDDLGFSSRKHPDEVTQQRATAQNIRDRFSSWGYNASDYQGSSGSYKDTILANITYNEQNYHRVAVVDFDHGVGRHDYTNPHEFHYMIEDNIGWNNDNEDPNHENLVYDMDIYDATGENTTFFAFINTCLSADIDDWEYVGNDNVTYPVGQGLLGESNDRAQGMPFAWTHRLVKPTNSFGFSTADHMSSDGYSDPDGGKFCYIGFPSGSASLNQTFHPNYPNTKYAYWVHEFFAYALIATYEMTVNEALDEASLILGGVPFENHVLHTGFTAEWPMYNTVTQQWYLTVGYNSNIVVYGDGTIKLYQPLLTVNAYDSLGGPLVAGVTIDGVSVGSTSISKRVFATFPGETHTIHVAEPSGYTFQKFMVGANTYLSNPISISVDSAKTVNAYFTQNPPPTAAVNVVIDSVPYDGYTRYHALTVDNQIPTVFWTGDWHDQYPGAIIATTYDTVHYETAFNLTQGYHTIEYAVSCYVGYWHVTMTVNGQVEAQQDSDVYDHVIAQIYVNPTPNSPPNTPTLSGPSPPTYVNQSYQFSAYSTDPNGDNIYYTFYWGDTTQTTVGPYSSGTTGYANHTWITTGQKLVTVRAHDVYSEWSGSSSPCTINITDDTHWLSPTSAVDYSSKWGREIFAYDDKIITFAYVSQPAINDWCGFLGLRTASSIFSNKLRIYCRSSSPYNDGLPHVDIDVYDIDTLSWVDVYEGDVDEDTWVEKAFSTRNINEMRFRFYNWYGTYNLCLFEADFWELTS